MTEVDESTSQISYLPYRDGDPSPGSHVENSADSDSSPYYSSSSEDEANGGDKPMKELAGSAGSPNRKHKTLHLKGKKLKALEMASMAIAIVIVLALFSLPVVFYEYESSKNHEMNSTFSTVLPSINTTSESNITCEGLSWGMVPSMVCTPELYSSGGVCRDFLLSWQTCALGSSDVPVTISISGGSQNEGEQDAVTFFGLLDAFMQSTSTECQSIASSFVCLYLFPLCDETGRVYLPSQELCLEVSTDVCQQEWIAAEQLDQNNKLPNCDDLPSEISNNSVNETSITSSTTNISNISCNVMFTPINGICIPDCYSFYTGPKSREEINIITVYVSGSFGLLTSIILFAASFWRRKIMWKFPYVFLMYVAIEYSILAMFILISLANRGLFCSDVNAIESTNNPTIYCTITGAVGHYFLISIAYFWFFHVCSTFFKVVFPHLAKRIERKQGFIHTGLVFLALFLPLPPVIVVLTNTDYEYTVLSYPPYICLSKSLNHIVFFSMVLVLNILFAIGVSLFIPMIWAIHKHRKTVLSSRRKKRRWRISIVEHKLLFTLGFFVVFGIMSLVLFSVVVAEQDEIEDIVQDYFLCEAPGQNANRNCDQYVSELTDYNNLATATYTLLGLFPLVILLFTINWKMVYKKTKAFLTKHGCIHPRPGYDIGPVAFSTYSPVPSSITRKE